MKLTNFARNSLGLPLAIFIAQCANVAGAEPQCPTSGWAEGLSQNLGPNATIPVDDTKAMVDEAGNWVDQPNCAFHQWSWETFIWATDFYWKYGPGEKITGVRSPRFLSMHTPAELSGTRDAADGKLRLKLSPRLLKPGSRIEKFRQAGSEGILVDLQHNAVLYSVHMNDAYFDFVKKSYGRTPYDKVSPSEPFPLGAAVFKASWKIVPGASDQFFTTQALVPVLAKKDGKVVITGSQTAMVALVGLHVVGRTEDHPEFIWGSFEQVNNAPALPDPADFDSAKPVSGKSYTFYTAGTPADQCNQMIRGNTITGGKFAKVNNVFRQYARGGETVLTPEQFDGINSQAQGQMRALLHKQEPDIPAYPLETVWANYMLIGTVWQPLPAGVSGSQPVPPTIVPGDARLFASAAGSVELENATLETFVQGPQNNGGGNSNCFMCHNTGGSTKYGYPGKDVNLSHLLLAPLKRDSAAQAK